MRKSIVAILKDAQKTFNHVKKLKLLEALYKSADYDEFCNIFLSLTQSILQENNKNIYVKRVLEFISKFVVSISGANDRQADADGDDIECNEIFTNFVLTVLKYHNVDVNECRYNVCSLVSFILQNLSTNVQLDGELCDTIQIAMLQNIQDSHPTIRIQAILALIRLQDPLNSECPVVEAFTKCLHDHNHLVRKEAVKGIAANATTIPKIVKRTVDVDPRVRQEAFIYCGNLGTKCFRIIHRHFILLNGFNETNPQVKKVFLEYLIPKWLTSINGDCLAFFTAIRLDSDEHDILNTEKLCQNVMEQFVKTLPMNQIIEPLELDADKVIPFEKMKIELAQYWTYLVKYLKKADDTDDIIDSILPDLTTFCNYLQKIINSRFFKSKENETLKECQHILYYIIDMIETYELSEEAGRKALDNLLKGILQNCRLEPRLLEKIIKLESDILPSSNVFTNDMCVIMSHLQSPFQLEEIEPVNNKAIDFEIARFKVRINTLEIDLEEALNKQDYHKASVLKNEISKYERQIDELNKQLQMEDDKPKLSQKETNCWCLDILALAIKYCKFEKNHSYNLTPSLQTCRNEFLNPLLTETDDEIKWRVHKCVALFAIFDREYAINFTRLLCLPIVSYRMDTNFSKEILILSITAFSDLIRVHGTAIFNSEDDSTSVNGQQSETSQSNTTKRNLYSHDTNKTDDQLESINDNMTLKIIIHDILDMLDDEAGDLREAALTVIAKLVLNSIYVNPWIITKLILHWYSPISENLFLQKLGYILQSFIKECNDSMEILIESMIKVVDVILKAPTTSPLSDIDVDSVVKFIVSLYDAKENTVESPVCKLASWIIHTIATAKGEIAVNKLTRLLNNIDVNKFSLSSAKEIQAHVELLQDGDFDRFSKLHIHKFIAKLKNVIKEKDSATTASTNNQLTEEIELLVEGNKENVPVHNSNETVNNLETIQEQNEQEQGNDNQHAKVPVDESAVLTPVDHDNSNNLSSDTLPSVIDSSPLLSASSSSSPATTFSNGDHNDDVIPRTQETSAQKKRKIPELEPLCTVKRTRQNNRISDERDILAKELSVQLETSTHVIQQAMESRRLSINLTQANDTINQSWSSNSNSSTSSTKSNRSNHLSTSSGSSESCTNSRNDPKISTPSSGRYHLRRNCITPASVEQLNHRSTKRRKLHH